MFFGIWIFQYKETWFSKNKKQKIKKQILFILQRKFVL